MWSMMSLTEPSLRVPMIIDVPNIDQNSLVFDIVELIDVYPTILSMTGLPIPSSLPGKDLSNLLLQSNQNQINNFTRAAFSEITRCLDCNQSYVDTEVHCEFDAAVDSKYMVPCCKMPRNNFLKMGVSVRTSGWRLNAWCPWDGYALQITQWTACELSELYDHRNDTSLFDVDDVENVNLASDLEYQQVKQELFQMIVDEFSRN